MKKCLLILIILITANYCYAQVLVDSTTGHVSIGNTSPNNDNELYVKWDATNENVYDIKGMQVDLGVNQCDYATGINIMAHGIRSATNPGAVLTGVRGSVYGGLSGHSYGVTGILAENNIYGAAIYGTALGFWNPYISSNYAGYFDGKVRVTDNLYAKNVYITSDINLAENVKSLSSYPSTSALNNLMNMNVITYNLKDRRLLLPERPVIKSVVDGDSVKEIEVSSHQEALNEKESNPKNYYGLIGQELQMIYPDLVTEDSDGFLEVNYIEMIPILVQSIQELKKELDAVKGGSNYKTRSIGDETTDFYTPANGNVLYQNTPNPFKEQTTIRFHLADDATNAAICIFDMSGKMLKELPVSPGMTSVTVNGFKLGEGLFLYSLMVNGREIDTKRMILSK